MLWALCQHKLSLFVCSTALLLSACGGAVSQSPSGFSFPPPPAGSPDLTGQWSVYICGTDSSCSPSAASYQGTLTLYVAQEPAIYDSFQDAWTAVLDGNGMGGVNVGNCVVASFRSDSSLKWQADYPKTPASLFLDADTDTQGDRFTMQTSDWTKPGFWQASPDCGSGIASLSGTFQIAPQ